MTKKYGMPDEMLERVWGIRQAIAQHKLRRVVSTRTVESLARYLAAGATTEQGITQCVVPGWTVQELTQVGER